MLRKVLEKSKRSIGSYNRQLSILFISSINHLIAFLAPLWLFEGTVATLVLSNTFRALLQRERIRFYDECLDQYEDEIGEKVWRMFIETFNCMPLAAIVGGKVFCAHGGISPWINSLEDINSIERPLVIPPYGMACDLLWSDPAQPDKNGWGLSHRGISFTYGRSVIDEFCAKNDVALIIRGHQLFKEMYPTGNVLRFGGRLISLFSALNYEGHKNNSSVLKLDFDTPIAVKQILFRCRHYAPLKQHEIPACRDMKFYVKQERSKWSKIDSVLGEDSG
uniref:SER_THR_PHOSPHATASE domain-containing protein n=1 Tax=Caenorhabditis japonica TaxID=281687 RepID=A0A8R1HZS1_CAEJA